MLGFQILPDDQTRPDATGVPPKADSLLAAEQWGSFSEILVDMYHRKNIRDFHDVARKLIDREKSDFYFRKNHSEPMKLVKIRQVRPKSTTEVERIIGSMGRVMDEHRTPLTADHTEACTLISHESRHRYGSEEKFKAVDWLVDAAPFLARFRKDHSKSVRKVQKRKASKKQN